MMKIQKILVLQTLKKTWKFCVFRRGGRYSDHYTRVFSENPGFLSPPLVLDILICQKLLYNLINLCVDTTLIQHIPSFYNFSHPKIWSYHKITGLNFWKCSKPTRNCRCFLNLQGTNLIHIASGH